jgi:NTE family protein
MIDFLTRALGGDKSGKRGGKRVNLALQGGGAHGAFTWGVLDQLLEDGRLAVEGISGTSAGAVNAVMLADGLARGGPKEAQKRLAEFWRAASLGGDLPGVQRAVLNRLFSLVPTEGPSFDWLNAWSRHLSPYDVNPLNINPLKELIERFVDFEALRREARPLFIAATNVQTGRLHVFPREKISAEAVMASACLPAVFRAVEIDGAHYWDGGYLGNPVLFPFFRATDTEDVLIVQINPVARQRAPRSSREIMSRACWQSRNTAERALSKGHGVCVPAFAGTTAVIPVRCIASGTRSDMLSQ